MTAKKTAKLEELIAHEVTGDTKEYDFESITPKYWTDIQVHNASGDHPTIETVCGPDNRVRVANTRLMPYQAICKLYMRTRTNKNYIGSGYLTHGNKVVTAGHCVYDHDEGGWMESIIIVPGKNGPSEPYGRYTAGNIAAVRGWTEERSERYDMGVIKLSSNVSHSGRIQMELANSDRATVCGYPGDRDQGVLQYQMEDILSHAGGRFSYTIDTFGGQSGGPLLKNATSAIGIHNYGGCPNRASDLYQRFIEGVDAF